MSTTAVPKFGLALPAIAEALPMVEREIQQMATSSSLPQVNEASGRITSAGGKRLRSMVILTSALALGGAIDRRTITSAACVEMLHAGSLVHDDLMDNAAERRGVPTVNAAWGVGPAVLVGDFMLARASQAAMRDISPFAAGQIAAAVADLVEGQFMEVLDLYDLDRTPARALRSIELKTGALFRVGCVLANHCADSDHEAAMAEYGTAFGLLFQILDDLLDLQEDIREGVYSFPLLHVLDDDLRAGIEIGTFVPPQRLVRSTLEYCRRLAGRAARAVPEGTGEPAAILRELPAAYLNWASTLIA